MTGRKEGWSSLLVIALLAVLARLPWLTGPHVVLDGDEGVLTLMARHLGAGESLPLFFYGQRYGFAIVEAGTAAAGFALFGFSVVVLKASMLGLWLVGAWLLAQAAGARGGRRARWIAALLIALLPAWMLWAMKARGGYVTAFVLFHGTLALLWRVPARERRSAGELALLGALCACLLLAQFIWAVPMFFFVAAFLIERRNPRDLAPFLLSAVSVGALALLPGWLSGAGGWQPSMFNAPDLTTALVRAPGNLWAALSGAFYLQLGVDEPVFEWASGLLCAGFLLASSRVLWRTTRGARSARDRAQLCALLGGLAVFALASPTTTPRYFLPLADLAVLLIALELSRESVRRWVLLLCAVVFTTNAAWAALELRGFPLAGGVRAQATSESEALEQLLDDLEARGVHHVFSLDSLLQWIVSATSDERVIARWKPATDRIPRYVDSINRALAEGQPVALVGYSSQASELDSIRVQGQRGARVVASRYVVYDAPTRAQLEALGFRF